MKTNIDNIKFAQRHEVIIGNAHLLDLDLLVADEPVRLLAMGHRAGKVAPALDNQKVEPLDALDYLVVGAGGDKQELIEAIAVLKDKAPWIRVILADSAESPMFPKNQGNRLDGIERVIYVHKKLFDASRSLLYHKAGLLAGCSGHLACGVAFTLAQKIKADSTVAFSITNFDLNTAQQLQ